MVPIHSFNILIYTAVLVYRECVDQLVGLLTAAYKGRVCSGYAVFNDTVILQCSAGLMWADFHYRHQWWWQPGVWIWEGG